MKNLYIADIKSANINGKSEGHYFAVAENYTNLFSGKASTFVAGGPLYKDRFANYYALPYDTIPSKGKSRNKLATFLNACSVLRKIENSVIIFQCSAVSTVCLALTLIKPKSEVYLIQYDTYMLASKIKRIIFNQAKKRIKGIICPGHEIGEALQVRQCVVPDYIYCQNDEDATYSEKKYDFGMFGILANGKGVYEAAEALAKTTYRVKIAGKVANLPEDQEMISKLKKLCEKHDNIDLEIGYLSDEAYDTYIKKTKYIVLNYSDSYALRSSGVILDAIYRKTPVIVRQRKYAEFVRDHNIGIVYDDISNFDFAASLEKSQYQTYIENIGEYLQEQDMHRKRLVNFVMNTGLGE